MRQTQGSKFYTKLRCTVFTGSSSEDSLDFHCTMYKINVQILYDFSHLNSKLDLRIVVS